MGGKLKEELLKSIAYPSLMFFAPFGLAMFNLAVGVLGIAFCLLFGYMGYIWIPMVGIFVIHLMLVALAKHDPHIDNLLRARSNIKARTENIIKEKGNKFAP
jgi:type IV secretory pathway TrbD component